MVRFFIGGLIGLSLAVFFVGSHTTGVLDYIVAGAGFLLGGFVGASTKEIL